jgi:hypothetical protein
MRRPLQDGQTPRPLQEKATTNPVRHDIANKPGSLSPGQAADQINRLLTCGHQHVL